MQSKKNMKLLALLLITVSLFCLFATSISALEIGNEVIVGRRLAYRGGQQSGEGDIHAPGTRATHYNNRPYWYNGWSIDVLTVSGSGVDLKAQYGGKSYIYCIEYGAHYDSTMTSVVEGAGAQLTNSAFWRSLGQTKQILLQRLMPHCFPALTPAELGVSSVDDAYAASQVIIWEVVQGYRDINGNLTNAALRDQYLKYTYTYGGHTTGDDTPAMVAYNNISHALATHTVKPSWDQSTVSMTWNDTAKRYEASITDTNGVLNQFTVSNSDSGVNVVRSGNTLTLWSGTALSGSVTLRLNKNLKRAADTGALAIFGGASSDEAQKMMYGLLDDPVNSNLAITTDSGTLSLKKTTTVSGGRVSNIEFSVCNAGWNGGIAKSVYTNSSGMLTLSLPVGKYLVSEVTEFAGVEKPAPQMVTILPGQTTSVSFVNKPKSTTFKVRKVDYSYGRVANIPFRIEQTSMSTGYNFIYRSSTDSAGEIHITSTAVRTYYQSFMSRYSNNITCAQAIWKDCYGTSTITDSAKYAQIRETVSHLRNGGSLSVVAGTYSIYELMWGIDSDTLDIEPAYYEGWEEENHEPYQEVTIDSTRNLVEFENYAKLSSLLILKTSEDGVVNGIPFLIELLDKDGHVQMTYATSQTVTKRLTIGGVTFEGAIYGNLFDTGTLRITELACAENGYVEQAPQLITLNPNSRTTAIFSNVVKPCVTTIVKTSESGNVKGFVFHITGTTDWGQTVNLTGLTTDASGKISVELKPGTYTVQEMLTGSQGNIYNQSAAQSLTITRGQETATVNFHNHYKPATVTIQKTSDSGMVDGFLFAINGTAKSGQEISIPDLVTDANGKIVIELKPGTYTVEEILTEEQAAVYKQPAPQTFTISEGQSTATVTVYNAYITVPLSLYKYDFNHNSAAGFAFAITGTTDNGETVRLTDLVTDKNGSVKVDLRPGVYTVTEVLTEEQAKVYEQPTPKTVTIKLGQTSAIVTFSNQAKKLPVSIIKTSDDGQVAGFAFEISGTAANYNTVKLSGLVTDEDGAIQVELYPGTYTITEVLTSEQAKIYQQPQPQQLTIPLGQTTVEAVKFHNVVKFGSITIQKTNTAGEVLAGAEYLLEISDDNGTTWRAATESDCTSAELTDGRLITGAEGIVKFDGLSIGRIRYRITETKAPAGCSLLVSPVFNGTLPFQGNGVVLTHLSLTVSDSLIPTLPATGSNGLWMVTLCAAIALLLMVGSGLAVVRARKSAI